MSAVFRVSKGVYVFPRCVMRVHFTSVTFSVSKVWGHVRVDVQSLCVIYDYGARDQFRVEEYHARVRSVFLRYLVMGCV